MKSLLSIFSILFIMGCATTQFTATGVTAAPYSGVVKVFHEKPDIPFTEVGIVSSFGNITAISSAGLIASMQRKAAAKGANALIIIDQEKNRVGGGYVGTMQNQPVGVASSSAIREFTALAIRLQE